MTKPLGKGETKPKRKSQSPKTQLSHRFPAASAKLQEAIPKLEDSIPDHADAGT